jgi:hypothetical protein
MRSGRGACLVLAAAVSGFPAIVRAQEASRPASQPDFSGELEKLQSDYYEKSNLFYDRLHDAKPEERSKLESENPEHALIPTVREFAARAKGTGAALVALSFMVHEVARLGPDGEKAAREALDEIEADYLSSPRLEEGIDYLLGALRSDSLRERVTALVRAASERSPYRSVRAFALSYLGTIHDAFDHLDEAHVTYQRLRNEYPETFEAARAADRCFVYENLMPGNRALDFEAVDQDGKKFKLSDYRGKVVVLDFWGFW